jgi:lipopolysaccharide export system permease protein
MRTLTRYTIYEFLKVFLLGFMGITLFMLLVGIGRTAVREGLSAGPILRLVPFILPDSMRFSIPAAALLSACTVFGRMSGENEIVAIKSIGASPWSVLAPVFVVGFLISVSAVWINDVAVSWGRPNISRVVSESIEQIAYGMLQTKRNYRKDGFSLTVKSVEGRKLILPTLTLRGDDTTELTTVSAKEAELRRNDDNTLSILLTDAMGEGPDGFEGGFPGTFEYSIPLQSERQVGGKRSPSDYALHELDSETEMQSRRSVELERRMATEAALQLLTADTSGLTDPVWGQNRKALNFSRYRRNRLLTEPWRRWANGFSCFFFVLVGAPLAIRKRHADFIATFFVCFLPILLVYYPLMAYGVDQAKSGDLPQYAVWLGNVICLLWAAWLIRRVIRY